MECTWRQGQAYTFAARYNNSSASSDRILAFGFIALGCPGLAVAFAWPGALGHQLRSRQAAVCGTARRGVAGLLLE